MGEYDERESYVIGQRSRGGQGAPPGVVRPIGRALPRLGAGEPHKEIDLHGRWRSAAWKEREYGLPQLARRLRIACLQAGVGRPDNEAAGCLGGDLGYGGEQMPRDVVQR